jgi:hypothetical protein
MWKFSFWVIFFFFFFLQKGFMGDQHCWKPKCHGTFPRMVALGTPYDGRAGRDYSHNRAARLILPGSPR